MGCLLGSVYNMLSWYYLILELCTSNFSKISSRSVLAMLQNITACVSDECLQNDGPNEGKRRELHRSRRFKGREASLLFNLMCERLTSHTQGSRAQMKHAGFVIFMHINANLIVMDIDTGYGTRHDSDTVTQ